MSEGKEIPKGWEVEKLGDICFTTSGGTPSRKNADFYNGTIPWIKSGELDKGLINKAQEYITEKAVKNSSAKVFPKGTLLIALYGATIGKLGFLGIDAATNQAICGIYESEIIDLKYLNYLLFNKRNKLVEQGAGGAQPNISQTILKNTDIPLPPHPEQHRIVAKIEELFSSLDKGIESLKTAQVQLKVYRQAVLKWAFEGKLTNENVKEGELPEGWKLKTFGDLFLDSPQNGIYKNISEYGSGTKILRIDGFYDGVILHNYEYKRLRLNSDELERYQLCTDDIVVNRVNSMAYLGKCGIVRHLSEPVVFESNIMRIKVDIENILPNYITLFLTSQKGLQGLRKNAKQAVNQASINQTDVSNVEIPLPLKSEQINIVQEIESRLSVCDKIEESISTSLLQAEALRQSILKKAFEGKLVSQDPNDEPASVLLERIKAAREKNKPAEKVKVKKEIKVKAEL